LNFMKALNVIIDSINAIPFLDKLLGGSVAKFDISSIAAAADKAADQSAKISKATTATAEAVIADANETTKAVRAIGESGTDAAVALDEFVKGTSTGASKITVDREKIQFAINLNVNLVADKLAEALSDKAIVSEDFVLTRAGGGITPSVA